VSPNSTNNDSIIYDTFGLTYEQSRLMFSVQKMIAQYDSSLAQEKALQRQKTKQAKLEWVENWEKGIAIYLDGMDGNRGGELVNAENIKEEFEKELSVSPNKTWVYIIALECLEFSPYTPLGGDNDKAYKGLNHNASKCHEYVKAVFADNRVLSAETLDQLHNTYTKSINQISGKAGKMATKVLAVVAIGAIAAALTAVGAGPIAVGLFGSQFSGLTGIALTNACLALAGGGAIAAGGLGMAGGVAIIAGGGALLGLAGGGTAVGMLSYMMCHSPEYALTQSAKLETILKEVILNAQKDVVSAQTIISQYRAQIDQLNKKITELETDNEKHKEELKNLHASIKYLKKSCQSMNKFTSSFQIGIQSAG